MLDIFNSDAFGVRSLTAAINKIPHVPGRIGSLGIFEEEGVATTTIAVEDVDGTVALVPTSKRGAPGNQNVTEKRNLRAFTIPHLQIEDTIYADEVQGVRSFGSDNALEGVQTLVNNKMARMARNLDATLEYGRIGAIKGSVLDSDGSTVIYNYFTEFAVAQQTVDFVLGTATTNMVGKSKAVLDAIETALGGMTYTGVHVVCGASWYEKFVTHAKVEDAFKYYMSGQQPMREDLRYRGFNFSNMTFEQYRGTVGSVAFVATGEAYAFPVGVPGMYLTRFAPADFIETANTVGLPRYAKQWADPSGRFVNLHTQTNPLSICTMPRAVIKLTTSN